MRKLKMFMCIILSLALISPSLSSISLAEESTTKEIKEVDIKWSSKVRELKSSSEETEALQAETGESVDGVVEATEKVTEEIMIGEFDISSIYENGSKIYLGSSEVTDGKIDFNLNDVELKSVEFKKSGNTLNKEQEGYSIAEITNNLNGKTTGVISVPKQVFDSAKLETMKVVVSKVTVEEIVNEDVEKPVVEESDKAEDSILENDSSTGDITENNGEEVVDEDLEIDENDELVKSIVDTKEGTRLEVIESGITGWERDDWLSPSKYSTSFKIPNEYKDNSKIYLGGENISTGKKNGFKLLEKDVHLSFERAGEQLDKTREDYNIVDVKGVLEGKKAEDSINIEVERIGEWIPENPLKRLKVIVVNEVKIADRYLPIIDGSNAVVTPDPNNGTDTYPLTLDWKKTKTEKSGSTNGNIELEKGTVVGNSAFKGNNNQKVLSVNPDALPGYSGYQPLQMSDIVKGSNGSYKNYYLDYRSLLSYIEPQSSVNWKPDNQGVQLDGWSHTSKDNSNVSWRMYRGAFKLSEEQIKELESKNAQLFLGVQNNKQASTILGVNDYLSVLVNGQMTGLNVSTSRTGSMNLVTYNSDDPNADTKTHSSALKLERNNIYNQDKCNDTSHNIGASINHKTVDGWHLHLNKTDNTQSGSSKNAALLGDITDYVLGAGKDPSKVHRLEMLTGEFDGIGGVTKLEVYYVKKPKISAKKTAYTIENGTVTELGERSLTPGDNVYFKFAMENRGKVNITDNIHFADYNTDLGMGVYIDKDGVYKTNETLKKGDLYYGRNNNGFSNIVVKKYKNNNGNWVEIDNDKSSKEKLSSLKIDEKIEVTSKVYDNPSQIINNDAFSYTVKDTDVGKKITNTVKAACSYMGSELDAHGNADVSFNITEAKIKINKSIVKVNGQNPQIEKAQEANKDIVITSPRDKVTFKINLKNEKKKEAVNLSLEDLLKLVEINGEAQDTTIKDSNWEFYSDENCTQKIDNIHDFKMMAEQSRDIYATYIIGEDQAIGSTFKNTATIYQTPIGGEKTMVGSDDAYFVVRAKEGSLKFVKEVDLHGKSKDDQKFTVNIKGTDGSEYNILLTPGNEETLKGLKHRVTYTIEEKVVPMNYENTDISFENKGNGITDKGKVVEVTLIPDTDGKLVTISNKKVNDEGLFDKGYIKNVFKYVKDAINGGAR